MSEAPTPEEVAAAIAAVERFLQDTAPPAPEPAPARVSAWVQAARREGVERDPWR